jgi:hypothetical protein
MVAADIMSASTVVECNDEENILLLEDEGGATTVTARKDCTATKHRSKRWMVENVAERLIIMVKRKAGMQGERRCRSEKPAKMQRLLRLPK